LESIRFLNTRKKEKVLDEEGNIIEEISKDHLKELNYLIRLRANKTIDEFVQEIEGLGNLGDIRLRFSEVRLMT